MTYYHHIAQHFIFIEQIYFEVNFTLLTKMIAYASEFEFVINFEFLTFWKFILKNTIFLLYFLCSISLSSFHQPTRTNFYIFFFWLLYFLFRWTHFLHSFLNLLIFSFILTSFFSASFPNNWRFWNILGFLITITLFLFKLFYRNGLSRFCFWSRLNLTFQIDFFFLKSCIEFLD